MNSDSSPTLNYFAAAPARRRRFILWIVGATTIVVGIPGWFFLLRGTRILSSMLGQDPTLVVGWITFGLSIVALSLLLKSSPQDAIRLQRSTSNVIILSGAVLLQGSALLMLVPALSRDVLRYRIDGKMWMSGTSPYAVTPHEYVDKGRPHDGVDLFVPFANLHTIYSPVAQGHFLIARAIEEAVAATPPPAKMVVPQWPHSVYSLPPTQLAFVQRTVSAIVAVLSVAVLLLILTCVNRSPWYAILLGWNPLFIIETGGMGHVDVMGVLFLLLMIRALQSSRPVVAAAMLALAAGVKPPAVLMYPFLFRDARRAKPPVRMSVLIGASVLLLAIVYSPLLFQRGYVGWLRTMHVYATSWEANGSAYELIKATADESDGWSVQRAKDRARLLAMAALVTTILLAWYFRADVATAGYWIYLIALLLAPVAYPWYLLWALCFVPLLRGWQGMTALVWSATFGLSYLLWRTNNWVLPAWVTLAEYLPVYAMLLLELSLVCGARKRLETRTAHP